MSGFPEFAEPARLAAGGVTNTTYRGYNPLSTP
jgi:hypothetical protein